jgi:hypothetical protein
MQFILGRSDDVPVAAVKDVRYVRPAVQTPVRHDDDFAEVHACYGFLHRRAQRRRVRIVPRE